MNRAIRRPRDFVVSPDSPAASLMDDAAVHHRQRHVHSVNLVGGDIEQIAFKHDKVRFLAHLDGTEFAFGADEIDVRTEQEEIIQLGPVTGPARLHLCLT